MKILLLKQIFYYPCVVVIGFFISHALNAYGNDNKRNQLYEFSLNPQSIESQIPNIKQLEKLNRNYPDSLLLLVQLSYSYQETGLITDRLKAETVYRKLIDRIPDEPLIYYLFAHLRLQQNFTAEARRLFSICVNMLTEETDLTSSQETLLALAYLELGRLKETEFRYYHQMVALEDGHELSFDSEAEKLLDQSLIYYRESLKIMPGKRDALFQTGQLYFEIGDYAAMKDCYTELIRLNAEDKDAWLFLGLTFHHLDQIKEAFHAYEQAKKLMAKDERNVFENFNMLIRKEDPNDSLSFWTANDPLYLTDENERKLEHYSRMAYANLYFGSPENHLPGWKSDRGTILLRYGHPGGKDSGNPEAPFAKKRYWSSLEADGSQNVLTEAWFYDDIYFAFEDRFRTNKFTLVNSLPPGMGSKRYREPVPGQFKTMANLYFKDTPQRYDYFATRPKVDLICQYFVFPERDTLSRLEIYYALPINALDHIHQKNRYRLNLQQGIFLFNDQWRSVVHEKTIGMTDFDSTAIISIGGAVYGITHFSTYLEDGAYHLAIEIMDNASKKIGQFREDLTVAKFPTELFISPVVLSVYQDSTHNIINPASMFKRGNKLGIYFQIKNLTQFVRDSMAEPSVAFEISLAAQEENKTTKTSRWATFFKKLLGDREKDSQVEIIYTSGDVKPDTYRQLVLETNNLETGSYEITLSIVDRMTGKVAWRKVNFRIIE